MRCAGSNRGTLGINPRNPKITKRTTAASDFIMSPPRLAPPEALHFISSRASFETNLARRHHFQIWTKKHVCDNEKGKEKGMY